MKQMNVSLETCLCLVSMSIPDGYVPRNVNAVKKYINAETYAAVKII